MNTTHVMSFFAHKTWTDEAVCKDTGKRNARELEQIVENLHQIIQVKVKWNIVLRIREVLNVVNFKTPQNKLKLTAWNAFNQIYENFLGNKKVMGYENDIKIF